AAGGGVQQTLLQNPPINSLPVLVTNTPAQPVPVTGSIGVGGTVQAQQSGTWNVSINGTPTVQSQQSGTWNVGINGTPTVQAQQNGVWTVGITGTPTVQVASSATNPVNVRDVNDSVQPVQLVSDGNGNISYKVPAGKRLVVQQVSGIGEFVATSVFEFE